MKPTELQAAIRAEAKRKNEMSAKLGPNTLKDVAGTMAAIFPDDDLRHAAQEYLVGSASLSDATPGDISALFAWLRPTYGADEKRYKPTNPDALAEAQGLLTVIQPVPADAVGDAVGEEALIEAAQANVDSAIHESEEDVVPMEPKQMQPVVHQEAKCIIFTSVNVAGFTFNVTAREGATEEMILDASRALLGAVLKMQKARPAVPQKTEATPMTASVGQATVQTTAQPTQPILAPAPAPIPAPAPVASNGGKNGTGMLEQITVNPDGKIEFKVSGLKFPLKDARGAEVVAGLFAPDTGITAAHLSTPAIYTAAQLGVMYVDWSKPDRYYDVIRVRR